MDASIASVVVLPDAESPPPTPAPSSSPTPAASSPTTSFKRRQSSVSQHDAKRARLHRDDAYTDRPEAVAKTSTPATKGRERGRERRLFGSVLGALSQNPATAAQRRRFEIEKRQQAQRKLEDEEGEQRKLERLAKRKAQRWRQQTLFEQDSMRIRHNDLLAIAQFLRTTAQPPLLYRPWETTPDEDDRIRAQIAYAQGTIRRELEDASKYGKESHAEGKSHPTPANDGFTDARASVPTDPDQQDDPAEGRTNGAVSEERVIRHKQHSEVTGQEPMLDKTNKEAMDEIGGEVVDAAEDMVIY